MTQPVDLYLLVAHTAEYHLTRDQLVRWFRDHAPFQLCQFTDKTAKHKLATTFASCYIKENKHELERTIEQAIARE